MSQPSLFLYKQAYKEYVLTSTQEVEEVVKNLCAVPPKVLVFDTETTGLNFPQSDIVGLGLYWGEGEGVFLPLGFNNVDTQLPLDALERLRPLFTHTGITKVAHNAKFDLKVLWKYGLNVEGVLDDTLVMAWLCDENAPAALDDVAARYDVRQESWKFAKGTKFADMDAQRVADYCLMDCKVTYQLYEKLWAHLEQENMVGIYEAIERPFVRVLAALENRGVQLDVPLLETQLKDAKDSLFEMEHHFVKETGGVSISSNVQLARYLKDTLGYSSEKVTAKGAMSVDEDALTHMYAKKAHPTLKLILEHRKMGKILGTYLESFVEKMDQNGVLRANFNQCRTVTGRLSSNAPNLQNIPNSKRIPVRKVFVPREGMGLLVVDYSQIELRILAHFSQDPVLMQAYFDDADLHERTARQLFGIAENEPVPKELRQQAKGLNFGVFYGLGAARLAESTGLSEYNAKQYIAKFWDIYKVAKDFRESVMRFVREKGYVSTLTGRKRRFPALIGSPIRDNYHDFNAAFNTTIQGSAGDFCKMAMIRLQPELTKVNSYMLFQVHDELGIEFPLGSLFTIRKLVVDIMEHPFRQELRVPMKVNMQVAPNWAEAK